MTSTAKTDITADVSGLVDQTTIDAADVRNPIEDLLTWLRAGQVAVSAADTHVKTLADALTVTGRLTLTITGAGGDEGLEIGINDAGLVTVNGVQALENKTLIEPIIASFINAQHDHSDAVGGGQLDAGTAFASGTVPVARLPTVSVGQAGIAPEPVSGDENKALFGDGSYRSTAPTVGSVGLSMPDVFDVTGSPVTTSGTLAAALKSQAQNQVLASPDGAAGVPAFRGLARGDLPALAVGDLADGAVAAIVPWTTLPSAAAGITLNSIPATYGALLLQLYVRSTAAVSADSLRLRFNGDTGANYDAQRVLTYHNAQLVTAEVLSAAHMTFSDIIPAGSASAGYFGVLNIWLHGYTASTNHRMALVEGVLPISSASGNLRVVGGIGLWKNTAAAIGAIEISAGGGDFAAGSGYALFGVGV